MAIAARVASRRRYAFVLSSLGQGIVAGLAKDIDRLLEHLRQNGPQTWTQISRWADQQGWSEDYLHKIGGLLIRQKRLIKRDNTYTVVEPSRKPTDQPDEDELD